MWVVGTCCVDVNMLPPEILIWADTQFKGISDRAPNTEFGDLCAKPESSAEVLALSLESQMIVFITSTIHRATLAGLAGADDICNARATAAGLPGTYTAWLSDSANDAKDRVTQATVPYVRTDGQQVATDFASLLSCPGGVCLDAPIQFDEFGSLVVGPQFNAVWTGTNSDGSSAAQIVFPTGHCNNWTSLGGFGVHGQFNVLGVRWTRPPFPQALICSRNPGARLYCFQD